MFRASVPVAAVYKYRHLCRTEYQVGRPAKVRQGTCCHPVAEPSGVHQTPDQPFRLCIAAADRLHVAAAGGGRSPGTFRGCPIGFGGHKASVVRRVRRTQPLPVAPQVAQQRFDVARRQTGRHRRLLLQVSKLLDRGIVQDLPHEGQFLLQPCGYNFVD